MFIRVIITKFPNDNKKQLALAFISTVTPKFQNDSKLLDFQILDIGEGKILNIAKYNNKLVKHNNNNKKHVFKVVLSVRLSCFSLFFVTFFAHLPDSPARASCGSGTHRLKV